MEVFCPSCGTAYDIPPITRPRKLRCAACATEWRMLPAPETPPDAEPDAEVLVPAAPPIAGVVPLAGWRERALALLALPGLLAVLWGLSLVLVGLALFALWHWRLGMIHHWPASLRLYRLLPLAARLPAAA